MDVAAEGGISWSGPLPRLPREGFDVVRYQIRYQNSVSVAVDVTPWYRKGEEFDEDVEPATGPPVPFAKLPANIQKRVTEDIHSLRQLAGLEPFGKGDKGHP
jgi:hypothetical protein